MDVQRGLWRLALVLWIGAAVWMGWRQWGQLSEEYSASYLEGTYPQTTVSFARSIGATEDSVQRMSEEDMARFRVPDTTGWNGPASRTMQKFWPGYDSRASLEAAHKARVAEMEAAVGDVRALVDRQALALEARTGALWRSWFGWAVRFYALFLGASVPAYFVARWVLLGFAARAPRA